MTEYLLGLDAGNTMVKAALFAPDGSTVAVASCNSATRQPAAHCVERCPGGLWQAAAGAIRDCIEKAGVTPGAIRAVGAAGHGNGLYLLDRAGAPLLGIQSMDSRAESLATEMAAQFGERIAAAAHTRPWPAMTPVLLAWLARETPEIVEDAGHALLCKDVVVQGLTGRIGSDMSDLAGCGLLALPGLDYDDDLLDLYGIGGLRRLLPERAESQEVVGRVTAAASAASGLAEGTPVVAGLFDVLASALGAGTARVGEASIVAGSWSINQTFARRLPAVPRALLATVLGRDVWVSCEASPTSAANLEWFVQNFIASEADAKGTTPYALCNKLAAAADPAAEEPPVFHPYLYAGPVPGARGGFNALGSWHSRADMVRALFEGVAFNHRAHFAVLDPERSITEATLSGGAAKSPLWAQIFADSLNMKIRIADCEETGARGAAMAAGIGAGLFSSYPEAASALAATRTELAPYPIATARLDTRYARWLAYLEALKAAWAQPPQADLLHFDAENRKLRKG
ncbi:FGGY-family carbohydrate kinase [Tropicimonas marinistellae]|uniref:FGGY-family carbohydrate kinase n=1 Tax=Tropicimonas marinistellae TaxID=1739787 RepID=UPI00082A8CD7|nr:FGGY-family carbohydrate kinase [Tropicimonas marinistellae]